MTEKSEILARFSVDAYKFSGNALIRQKKGKALRALAHRGIITDACEAVGMARKTFYRWQEEDAEFAKAIEHARAVAADVLETEAIKRAMKGPRRKKFTSEGAPVIDPETGQQYVEYQPSDSLMQFLLRGHKPGVFRERIEHSGPDGKPLQTAGPVVIYMPRNNREAPNVANKDLGKPDAESPTVPTPGLDAAEVDGTSDAEEETGQSDS